MTWRQLVARSVLATITSSVLCLLLVTAGITAVAGSMAVAGLALLLVWAVVNA